MADFVAASLVGLVEGEGEMPEKEKGSPGSSW
jgi:hypothetical protein